MDVLLADVFCNNHTFHEVNPFTTNKKLTWKGILQEIRCFLIFIFKDS